MNTPTPTSTPRTDAATYPADCLGQTLVTNRDCARELERELAALTAERDQLRDQLAAARQRETVAIASWDEERGRALREGARVVELKARAERAEAELATATEECKNVRLKWHVVMGTCSAKADAIIELDEELARLRARAARAEDNLAALEQCHDDNCRGVVRIADELATAKERLRSEAMDDYAAIKDLQRELATERARLDWLESPAGFSWQWNSAHSVLVRRSAIDEAMKEGAN